MLQGSTGTAVTSSGLSYCRALANDSHPIKTNTMAFKDWQWTYHSLSNFTLYLWVDEQNYWYALTGKQFIDVILAS